MKNTIKHEQQLAVDAAAALKAIARRPDIKMQVEHQPQLYALLQRAAARYVTGEQRAQALEVAELLHGEGYAVSLEYIGENTVSRADCQQATAELMGVLTDLGEQGIGGRVSFDLSHIGLLVDNELALQHVLQLGELSQMYGIELFVSMEESAKTAAILDIYCQAVALYPLIGITLQAHLHRTWEDASRLLVQDTRVRFVKGAYEEPDTLALSRSTELDDRYVQLFELAVERGCRISLATHDESLIDRLLLCSWGGAASVELELLYGIRPELGVRLREQGYPVRVYLTYGQEWYLYLCHRIAEYPPNLYQALIDVVGGQEQAPVMQYRLMKQH
ncbi:proline dehydrogenase family protein [Paenibacillus hunanensis]|uniref:proline dehydrogenase family protein n=1 Tax=Paenibacillus hunanensis TaxID=539262 RepID=UPI002A6B1360|nr:proline dehydrogenase family protein [Paenibacillus hunanensis]WPP41583.1 proline dehydrogenase family protein [Paenibacillus hunanensis]